jgi:DNA-binding GntR family transcriptional regulator
MEKVIQFKSLTDQVYGYLSNSIIEGRIKPGEKLLENELCHQFGISRSPLRECFRILEAEGLISISPRRGAFVKEFSRQDLEDVFPVRGVLEALAARSAVHNITEKELEIFDDLIAKMEEALGKKDIKSFLRLNATFHGVFIKASNNKVLERTLKNLGKGIWLRIAFLYYQSPSGLDFSNKIHKEIVRAFRNKDVEAVQKLVQEHIEDARKQLFILYSKS